MVQSLQKDVTALVSPEGRLPGSAGHRHARAHIIRRVREIGLRPYQVKSYEMPYELGGIEFVNVLAVIPGADTALAPLLIAAHYDTFGPWPGADDNASAIAVLLAAAAKLKERGLRRDVICAFFDAEEPPYFLTEAMGSVHFYTHQRNGPVHAALVMDIVGHDVPLEGLGDLLFLTGMESDPALAGILRACEGCADVRAAATLNGYVGDLSDHHIFRLREVPYLFLSCGHWADYHRPTDTIEKLSFEKMAAVTEYLIELASRVAGSELTGPFEGYDTTETELYFLRKAFGGIADQLGIALESRQDIDKMIRTMITQFGL